MSYVTHHSPMRKVSHDPHLTDEETPRENPVLWSENRRQKL